MALPALYLRHSASSGVKCKSRYFSLVRYSISIWGKSSSKIVPSRPRFNRPCVCVVPVKLVTVDPSAVGSVTLRVIITFCYRVHPLSASSESDSSRGSPLNSASGVRITANNGRRAAHWHGATLVPSALWQWIDVASNNKGPVHGTPYGTPEDPRDLSWAGWGLLAT